MCSNMATRACAALFAAVAAGVPGAGAAPSCGAPSREHQLLQRRLVQVRRAKASVVEDPGLPSDEACHTLLEGEPCYNDVHWAMMHGIYDYSHIYPEHLSQASSFEEFQHHLHALNAALCPVPCHKSLRSYGQPCRADAVPWVLQDRRLVQNNLGGKGPDSGAEELRYERVGEVTSQSAGSTAATFFDLVIVASGSYQYHNQERNGLSGSYGVINMKAPSSVPLTFSFEDSATGAPVRLDAFHFSFFDIDQSKNAEEHMLVGGFAEYTFSANTEVQAQPMAGGEKVLLKSTRFGKGCDNPSDPLQLGVVTCGGNTVDQRKRSITFRFENTTKFDVELRTTCKSKSKRCGGRNFLFAGSSSLAKSCKEDRPGLCAVFGDPHFVTFDGAHTVLFGDRPLWLVKSTDVWIQALSTDSNGKLQVLAVGGPFMQHHTLRLQRASATTLQATLDGQAILSAPDSDRLVPGVVEAHRRTQWNSTLHNDEALAVRTQIQFSVGPWPERFLKQPIGGLFLFKFPGGIEVTATGVDFMTVVITMPPASGGQTGYCGNFNGEVADDFEAVSSSFHRPAGDDLGPVDPAESILGSFEPGLLQDEASSRAGRSETDPDAILAGCHEDLLTIAERRCREVANVQMREECILDVCATGLVSAADSVVAAELLETKVNARGIPLLVGAGRCLDVVGRQYLAISTQLEEAEECKDVLRSLAFTEGVVGAQLQEGGSCQVLVEPAADYAAVSITHGWGEVVDDQAKGHGIICAVSEEAAWNCWQLA